jgi:diaminopimelate epimerase
MSDLLLKTEGAGNDFLIGMGVWSDRFVTDGDLVRRLCDRRRGIGADGVLALRPASDGSIGITHRNADGSGSAFCANATRCAARVAVEHLGFDRRLIVTTGWVAIPAAVDGGAVTLELPPPSEPIQVALTTELGTFDGWHLSVGVPHLVVPTTGLDEIDLGRVARPLRSHPDLDPEGANVHLVELGDDRVLRIRSLERGVPDEVLCCGSGVVAAALVTMADRGGRELTVVPRSAEPLVVRASAHPPMTACRLTGPARIVAVVEPVSG